MIIGYDKERNTMKKLMSFITAVIILSVSLTAFAANSNISIKNNEVNSTPVSYLYDGASSGEIVKSIKSLMTKLDDLTRQNSVVQTLTISSISADKKPVNFKLRLSLPEQNSSAEKPEKLATPSPDEYTALDYYKIKVTTANGDVIYDSANVTDETEEQKSYKDIPLGTLNETAATENRIYNLTISADKSLNKNSAVTTALRKLDWSIVSDTYDTGENKVAEASESNEQTESKETDDKTEPTVTTQPSPAATAKAESSEAAEATTVTLKKGEYVVGTDIPAGRYKMTGEGKASVYTPEDIVKMTVVLKHKGDTETNGVEEYVMSVADGETLKIDNEVTLTPHRAQAILPSPTPTAKSSASSSSGSGTGRNSTTSSSSSKTNPKTGDTTPVMLVTIIGIAALAGIGVIEYKKRRMSK